MDSGNPNLEPDNAKSFNIGAAMSMGPVSLNLDWFRINISDRPARLDSQMIVDLEAKDSLPASASVIRDGDVIRQIVGSWGNLGEDDVKGLDLRAQVDWANDFADMALNLRWSHLTDSVVRIAGQVRTNDYPRDRVYASLHAGKGRVSANWTVYAVSGYQENETFGTNRYDNWTGHDIALQWREAFGLQGLGLAAGVLNVFNRGPSTTPNSGDMTRASSLGRTLFVNAKISFAP